MQGQSCVFVLLHVKEQKCIKYWYLTWYIVIQVKPQQLQSPLEPDSLSNSAGSGGMLGVPVEDPNSSLQSMLTSQHPFQSFPIGTSQILQQEPRVCIK